MKGRRMKTRGQLAIAVLALALFIAAVPAVAQERVDLIILLDSSRSMFRYYNQVIDFVVSDAVREYLRFGDGFHLMNFADTTQLEVAQVLRTEEDVRTVLSRLYLMYPLGRNTDLISALKGVSQYVSGLSSSSPKYIILITDGMHSPARESIYAAYSTEEVRAEMERSASRIRERGWTMRIVQVPFNGAVRTDFATMEAASSDGTPQAGGTFNGQSQNPGRLAAPDTVTIPLSTGNEEFEALSDVPGTGDYIADIASALGTSVSIFDPENVNSTLSAMVDILQISFPENISTRRRNFTLRLGIENPGERQIPLELESILLPDGSNVLSSRAIADLDAGKSIFVDIEVSLPDSIPEGSSILILEPRLANDVRVSPATSTIELQLKIPAFAAFFRNSASILIFLVILLAALAVLILIARYIHTVHRRAEEPVLQAFMGSSESRDDSNKKPGSNLVSSPLSPALASGSAHVSPHKTTLPTVAAAGSIVARSTTAGSMIAESTSAGPIAGTQTHSHASALSAQPGEDRSSLLNKWSQGDRNRYTLPLKSAMEKSWNKGSEAVTSYVYTPKITKPGTLRIELRVRNQNPFIGSRNIKTLHAGSHKTIGGKSSDFLVFLLPVPKRIADIHYDGENFTIVPVRPSFFPDYPEPINANLGEEIRIVNHRGKELFLSFCHYISPLEKLNKLLHCIEVTGITHATDEIPPA